MIRGIKLSPYLKKAPVKPLPKENKQTDYKGGLILVKQHASGNWVVVAKKIHTLNTFVEADRFVKDSYYNYVVRFEYLDSVLNTIEQHLERSQK